jgi:hypothetical protein
MSLSDSNLPPGNSLDRGLAAAFAHPARPSVIETLSRRVRSDLGLHLPSAAGEERPTLRVADKATAEALRSPRYQILGELARGGVNWSITRGTTISAATWP